MSQLFFEVVPLIDTNNLGDFAEPQFIGHHYGDLQRTRVRCLKITSQLWLVGAHPWQSVDYCWVGGKRAVSFKPFIREDSDGVTRQYVELPLPPASDGFTVEVAGKGKMKSNGQLIENPADIIKDLAALCGKDLPFQLFKEACDAKNLRIAGSVSEARTLRAYITEIVESCGAVWAGGSIFFPLDPLTLISRVREPLALSHELSALDVCGKLSVYYNWNEADQWNGSHIQVEAVGSRYDTLGVYYAKWLRQPKDAERLARELLGKRAGDFVKVSALVPNAVKAGECLDIDSANFEGGFRVLTAVQEPGATEVTGELILSTFENIKVVRQTQEIPLTRTERVDVAILENGQVEIAVFDQQNRSLAGIFITLDGATTKQTSALGIATFELSSGDHTVVLSGEGIENSDPFPLYIP